MRPSLTEALADGAWHRVRYVYDESYGLKDVFVGLYSVGWKESEQTPIAGRMLHLERYKPDEPYPKTWDPGELRLTAYGLQVKGAWHRRPGAPGVTLCQS